MKERIYDRYLTLAFGNLNAGDRSAVLAELDLNYSQFLPASREGAILDIGCGMGHMLVFLKAKGYQNVLGVDKSREAIEYCEKNIGKNVALIDDLCSFLEPRQGIYELVVMKDIIEHLNRNRLVETLGSVRAALAPWGALLVETGNMAAWTGPFLFYNDFTHQSGFTEISLRQVLVAAGFRDVLVIPHRTRLNWRGRLLNGVWTYVLKWVYRAERGSKGVPEILTRLLVAVAHP